MITTGPWLLRLLAFFGAISLGQCAGNPTFDEVVKSKHDLWGEMAINQTNGPSYEFFKNLLPPPRYVNADFKYYPIVLSAPNAPVKARLISNGSGVNLHGGSRSWKENGTPFIFRVGLDELQFGAETERLELPTLAEGYLPVVQIRYRHPSPFQAEGSVPLTQARTMREPEIYQLEAFASTDPALAANGVIFVKFSLKQGDSGIITVQLDSKTPVKFSAGNFLNESGELLAHGDNGWHWERGSAHARLGKKQSAILVIATKPLPKGTSLHASGAEFEKEKARSVTTWKNILAKGMNVEIPEPVVNDAWRQLLIQNFSLIHGDRMNYSAGNQYEAVYEAEGSDAALALMVWGFEQDMRRLMVPLFEFTRKGLEFHQAGFKLQDLSRYYWQTRDSSAVTQMRQWGKNFGWETEAQRLATNRTGEHGLYPKEQYCGDIHTVVQSINASAKAWRSLRDFSAMLAETGDAQDAKKYGDIAQEFRPVILKAIEASTQHDTTPPFVPVALYTNEPAHDPICDTRIGSYWNIIIGYTIASGIFPSGSEQESWLPHYQEEHGGLCMGMLRAGGLENSFWNSEYKINPLYGTRYALDALRRDDTDRALVSFYGMLAQGFTRNTFICGEGCSLKPLDDGGRLFYLPPNSAANAHFLSMLRYLLVQDLDLDDDGKPETLRLCFGTPKRWLEDGKTIKIENAPTAFGKVSVKMESHLQQGEVTATISLPARNHPLKTLLRARVPDGWQISSATAGAKNIAVDTNRTVDLSDFKDSVSIHFRVRQN